MDLLFILLCTAFLAGAIRLAVRDVTAQLSRIEERISTLEGASAVDESRSPPGPDNEERTP